jgi:hypothetical protein
MNKEREVKFANFDSIKPSGTLVAQELKRNINSWSRRNMKRGEVNGSMGSTMTLGCIFVPVIVVSIH